MEILMISMGRTVLIALLVVTGAYCTKSKAADSIVGSWRLVTWVEVETESTVSIVAHATKPDPALSDGVIEHWR